MWENEHPTGGPAGVLEHSSTKWVQARALTCEETIEGGILRLGREKWVADRGQWGHRFDVVMMELGENAYLLQEPRDSGWDTGRAWEDPMHDRWYRPPDLWTTTDPVLGQSLTELVCDGVGVPGVGRAASGCREGALEGPSRWDTEGHPIQTYK